MPRRGYTIAGSARDKQVNRTGRQGLKAEGSGVSANVKRASQKAETTFKVQPAGHGKGEQGIQQETWDISMEELTFQLNLESRMGF